MPNTHTAETKMVHGHELRELIARIGRPVTEAELRRLVVEQFGQDVTFRTCCQQGLTLAEALDFFVSRDKLRLQDGEYSAAVSHECGGHGHGHDHARH